jgi:hypothetical protein
MTSEKRPLGVTILAVLSFIGAAFEAVLFILAIAAPGTLRSLILALSPQGSGPDKLLDLGSLLPAYFGAIAIVIGLLGYGMWTLRNWARLITIVIAALSLVGTIVSLVQIGSELDSSTILLGLVRVGVCVLILWYLTRPGIRSTFRSRALAR